MPRHCCVEGCEGREGQFSFPRTSVRDAWLNNLWAAHPHWPSDWQPNTASTVCHKHFSPECFARHTSLATRLQGGTWRPKLLKGSIPTIFVGIESQSLPVQQVPVSVQCEVEIQTWTEAVELPRACEAEEVGLATPSTDHCYAHPGVSSVAVQTEPVATADVFTQTCSLYTSESQTGRTICTTATNTSWTDIREEEAMETDSESEEDISDDLADPDWDPDMESGTGSDEDEEEIAEDIEFGIEPNVNKQRRFIVYESQLRLLMAICTICFRPCKVTVKRVVGSMISLMSRCASGHTRVWSSQPMNGKMPVGNFHMAAAILYAGCLPGKTLHTLSSMRVACISSRTYMRLQRCYLLPSLFSVWRSKQTRLLEERRDKELHLGGDGRCCTLGHTAKYGTYSLMDLNTSTVIDVQLVQSNEVKNSYWMELEGLKRALEFLFAGGLKIVSLTTDRHASVRKFLRDHYPDLLHYFDVWHIAKGLRKKLEEAAKKRECSVIRDWIDSIINHLYWCAATSGGDKELIVAKWRSMLRHMCNNHKRHGKKFPSCAHGDIEERAWLRKGSKAFKELALILENKGLLKDIEQLSAQGQTSSLESYHHVICCMAPKSNNFSNLGIKARGLLAAMHFNENANRSQAVDRQGNLQWRVSYPKSVHRKAVARPTKVPCSFDYVTQLVDATMRNRNSYPSYKAADEALMKTLLAAVPPPICSTVRAADKETVVAAHKSRFHSES